MKRTMKNNLKGLKRVSGGLTANGSVNATGDLMIHDASVVKSKENITNEAKQNIMNMDLTGTFSLLG